MLQKQTYILLVLSGFLLLSCTATRQVHERTVSQSNTTPRFLTHLQLPDKKKNTTQLTTTSHHREYKHKENTVVKEEKKTRDTTAPIFAKKTPPADKKVREKYAGIIGIGADDITNDSLYHFIDSWVGVPYRLGGNDKKGIDCSGFALRLYQEVFGVNLSHSAIDQYKNYKFTKKKNKLHEGDLVFFRNHGKRVAHVGIYLGNDYFVHASTSSGVMISSLNEDHWQRLYVGAGRVEKE